jgi:plastocyanin
MRRHLAGFVLVAAVALFATACSSSGGSSSGGSGGGGSGGSGGGGSTGGGTAIVAQNFAFSPSTVDVQSGAVTLTVTNKDSVLHTFTLDDGSSSTDLQPGTTQTITLDLSKTVGWHCSIHHSMTGTLKVA